MIQASLMLGDRMVRELSLAEIVDMVHVADRVEELPSAGTMFTTFRVHAKESAADVRVYSLARPELRALKTGVRMSTANPVDDGMAYIRSRVDLPESPEDAAASIQAWIDGSEALFRLAKSVGLDTPNDVWEAETAVADTINACDDDYQKEAEHPTDLILDMAKTRFGFTTDDPDVAMIAMQANLDVERGIHADAMAALDQLTDVLLPIAKRFGAGHPFHQRQIEGMDVLPYDGRGPIERHEGA